MKSNISNYWFDLQYYTEVCSFYQYAKAFNFKIFHIFIKTWHDNTNMCSWLWLFFLADRLTVFGATPTKCPSSLNILIIFHIIFLLGETFVVSCQNGRNVNFSWPTRIKFNFVKKKIYICNSVQYTKFWTSETK